MTVTVVRYNAKPEPADENQRLIETVCPELEVREAESFTNTLFRLDDGVSFIHVVIEHDVADRDYCIVSVYPSPCFNRRCRGYSCAVPVCDDCSAAAAARPVFDSGHAR